MNAEIVSKGNLEDFFLEIKPSSKWFQTDFSYVSNLTKMLPKHKKNSKNKLKIRRMSDHDHDEWPNSYIRPTKTPSGTHIQEK